MACMLLIESLNQSLARASLSSHSPIGAVDGAHPPMVGAPSRQLHDKHVGDHHGDPGSVFFCFKGS